MTDFKIPNKTLKVPWIPITSGKIIPNTTQRDIEDGNS